MPAAQLAPDVPGVGGGLYGYALPSMNCTNDPTRARACVAIGTQSESIMASATVGTWRIMAELGTPVSTQPTLINIYTQNLMTKKISSRVPL